MLADKISTGVGGDRQGKRAVRTFTQSVRTESGRGLAYPARSILLRLPQTLGSTLRLPCKGTQTGWGTDRGGGQVGRVERP